MLPLCVGVLILDVGFVSQTAWKQDQRSQEDIGVAVEIDPDGKAATLDAASLTGYGVSKPLLIGGQVCISAGVCYSVVMLVSIAMIAVQGQGTRVVAFFKPL